MSSFMLLRMTMSTFLAFSCTDTHTIDWIEDVIKKIKPKCKIYRREKFYLQINDKMLISTEVWWDIIELLCSSGWEPYAVTGNHDETYYFRKRIKK